MDNDTFAARIIDMQETLYRVAYSILPQQADREDAVQACILRAWHKRHTLREPRYMQSWVIRILINECNTLLRKRRRELPTDDIPGRVAPPPDADIALHDLFLSLEEDLRLPAVLFYMEDMPIREIASAMRLPAGTVKSRLHRARGKMRDALTKEVRDT